MTIKHTLMYGDWIIEHDPKPIPNRNLDWDAVHKDYDGGEDDRVVYAGSIEELIKIIDGDF